MTELNRRKSAIQSGGGPKSIQKQHEKGKLTARERLDLLFDANTFVETDVFYKHRSTAFGMDALDVPSDGIVCGYGHVNGQPVCAFAEDFTILGGSIGEIHTKKIVRLQKMAYDLRIPVVGMYDSGGARIQEGTLGLAGLGEMFYMNTKLSGLVPQISVIMGPCAGGAVYSPALTDIIIQVKGTSQMFLTGPEVVRTVIGENVTMEDLGGSSVHTRTSGVAHLEAKDDADAISLTKQVLSYLPANSATPPRPISFCGAPGDGPSYFSIPDSPNKAYDVLDVIRAISDPISVFQIQPDFARNIVTCFCRIDNRVCGVIASQPKVISGCLDIDSCDKAARFIRLCDCYNIPLLTLVDVPGFLPGTNQERGGVIRHGAKLIYAYCEATVPKITVILRKAYGGAYIGMCSKSLGADTVYALPTAQIAVMGAESAVNILYKKQIQDSDAPESLRDAKIAEYCSEFMSPYKAAEEGFISDVIEPEDMRSRISSDLKFLCSQHRKAGMCRHGNIPL